jgi:hypothetical protein
MHNFPCERPNAASRLVNRRGSTTLAVLLLSLGVGASTAAFTVLNGAMPHSAPFVTCETTIEYTVDHASMPASMPMLNVPTPAETQERISDVYQTSYEAADDAVDSWSDAAEQVGDEDVVGSPVLASLLGAGALVLLLACTRGAARALANSPATALYIGVALGALAVAGLLASVFGLPALGARAVSFMLAISAVAAFRARRGYAPIVSTTR